MSMTLILRARVKKRHDTAVASGVKPRTDDDPAVFEVRLAGYKKDIVDISAHYGPRLRIIDGNISAQETVRQSPSAHRNAAASGK